MVDPLNGGWEITTQPCQKDFETSGWASPSFSAEGASGRLRALPGGSPGMEFGNHISVAGFTCWQVVHWCTSPIAHKENFQLLVILELIVNVLKVQIPSLNIPKAHEFMAHTLFMILIDYFLQSIISGNLGLQWNFTYKVKCPWILTRNCFNDEGNSFIISLVKYDLIIWKIGGNLKFFETF